MWDYNGKLMIAEPLDILKELKAQLAANGIQRFHEFKVTDYSIQFCCPIHNNGQEHKPSCGLITKAKKGYGSELKPGLVHCFTCGYTVSLEEMISNCFGYNDMGIFGSKWLAKNFQTLSVEDRKDIDLDYNRKNAVSDNTNSYIGEDELDQYRYYHPYMFQRKLTEDVIDLYDIGYDKNTDSITFPVRDKDGNCLFITRRSVKSKRFDIPSNVIKPLYGVYELPNNVDEVIVCESQINALTCRVYGKWAVALFGTGTPYQYKLLSELPCRKLILALDPDDAGNRGREKIKKFLYGKKLISEYIIPKGKDINDLTEKEFENLQEIF